MSGPPSFTSSERPPPAGIRGGNGQPPEYEIHTATQERDRPPCVHQHGSDVDAEKGAWLGRVLLLIISNLGHGSDANSTIKRLGYN